MATAGPNLPTSAANDAGIGAHAWTNPTNALSNNASRATCALAQNAQGNYLKLTGFGFSIPSGATINGITVRIDRLKSGFSNQVRDNRISLSRAGAVESTNKAVATNYTTSDVTVTYGGSADLWSASWSADDINHADFGVFISCKENNVDTGTAAVDYADIQVDYTEAAAGAVPNCVHHYKSQGIMFRALRAASRWLSWLCPWMRSSAQ